MYVPKGFEEDLALARVFNTNKQFAKLIRKHEKYLRGICKYALRFNLPGVLSDEDDLFQELCIRLVHYTRRWNPDYENGATLLRYVLYNIGADITKIPITETRKTKCPETPPIQLATSSLNQESYTTSCYEVHGYSSQIKSNATNHTIAIYETHYIQNRDTERAVSIKRAVEKLKDEKPLIYNVLLNALLEQGTILDATKELRKRVRESEETRSLDDRKYARKVVRDELLPELQEMLSDRLK